MTFESIKLENQRKRNDIVKKYILTYNEFNSAGETITHNTSFSMTDGIALYMQLQRELRKTGMIPKEDIDAIGKHIVTFDFDTGEVIAIHIGQFFGINDLRVRTTSRAQLILLFDKKPTDLIENPNQDQASLSKGDSGEATDCSNYPACKHACGDELIKCGCNSDCPYYGVAEPESSLKLACNTPLCPTKKDGMKPMEHPGTNKQVYKCPGCECEVLIITEQSPQHAPIFSEDGSKDTRICACCKRTLPEDVEVCFQCIGYNHFEPLVKKATCGNCKFNKCNFSETMKKALDVCSLWKAKVSDSGPSGVKGKCLHLHGFYLEGGAKFCNDCTEEI